MIQDYTARQYDCFCIDLARVKWPQDIPTLYFVVRKMILRNPCFKPGKDKDEFFNRLRHIEHEK